MRSLLSLGWIFIPSSLSINSLRWRSMALHLQSSTIFIQMVEDYREESLWAELKVIMGLGFPFCGYPPSKGLFSGPGTNEISNEIMVLHFLHLSVYSFYWDIEVGSILCTGNASICSSEVMDLTPRFPLVSYASGCN